MENNSRLYDQVAAELGVTANRAKIALYVKGLANSGKPIQYVADSLRRKVDTIKSLSRDFMIDFVDYRPFSLIEKRGLERPAPKYDISEAL
jgi:hypothetical protein